MPDLNSPAEKPDDHVKVKLVKIGSVTIYQVSEDELKALEQGGGIVSNLSWSIFLFSIAFAGLFTWVSTVKFRWEGMPSVLTGIILAGFVLGFVQLGAWKRSRKPIAELARQIRNRNGGLLEEEDVEPENQPK